MRKLYQRIAIILPLFAAFGSQAQENDIDLFVKDMLVIADDFATPAAEGAAYQAGAGWFTSAESLGLWNLDFSVHANVLLVPDSKSHTSISSNKYSTFDIRGGDTAEIPTAFGGPTDVYFEGELEFMGNSVPFDFQALEGIDRSALVHPFVQASVGLPAGTDLTVRFLPEVQIEDVNFSTFGIGLKHNFNQYFNYSQARDFQFAALVAYSKFNVDYAFTPLLIENIAELNEIEVDADLWLLQVLTSKRFRNEAWNVFGSIGVTNSNFGYVVGGSGIAVNPINTALETLDNSEMEFKGDVGLTYDAGDFLFSGMFSQGKFSNLNLSLHYQL